MKSTPESIIEAQRALAQYMEEERQSRQCAPVDAGAKFDVEDEAQHSPDSGERGERVARAQAAEYVKARNQNLRPLRQIDQSDENAVEGRESALAFLERRRRSAIRK